MGNLSSPYFTFTWYVSMLSVRDIMPGDLLHPTSYLLCDWPVANYKASNLSKICQKSVKKLKQNFIQAFKRKYVVIHCVK